MRTVLKLYFQKYDVKLLTITTGNTIDFRFDTYVYWLAINNGYSIKREEFEFPPRKYGVSKWDYGISSKIKFSFILGNLG